MLDFIVKKQVKKDKPAEKAQRPIGMLIKRARENVPGSEHPIKQFRKLLGEFKTGLQSLSNIIRKDIQPIRAASLAIPQPPRQTERLKAIYEKLKKPLTGADKEAREHFDSHKAQPSVSRLAQILRADSLMRSGEIQPKSEIQAWAKAIKEGRRREIADMSHDQVQHTLYSAVGGKAAAGRLLSTPLTRELDDKHDAAIKPIKATLAKLEQRLVSKESQHVVKMPKSNIKPIQTRLYANEHRPTNKKIEANKPHEDKLREMVYINELSHDSLEASDRVNLLSNELRSANQVPAVLKAPSHTGVSKLPVNDTKHKASVKLSGRVKLMKNGQTMGEAEMSGELRS